MGRPALRRPGGADDYDRHRGDGRGGRRAREFAARGRTVVLPDPAARAGAIAPLLGSMTVDVRSGDATDLPACDPVVGVFPETPGGGTVDAELRDAGVLAAGAGRVHDAGTVRSWPGSAFGRWLSSRCPGPAVGRAIE